MRIERTTAGTVAVAFGWTRGVVSPKTARRPPASEVDAFERCAAEDMTMFWNGLTATKSLTATTGSSSAWRERRL
jgi:hypothetical protein